MIPDSLVAARLRFLRSAKNAAPVTLRLSLGALFFASGSGKLAHLERTAAFFAELGIPWPAGQAAFIGALECVGGLGLALGLGTRVLSLLLASTMLVALATAVVPEAEGLLDVVGASEAVYLAALLGLLGAGPGPLSVDALLSRSLAKLPVPETSRLAG